MSPEHAALGIRHPDACAQNAAVFKFVLFSSGDPSEAPDERDLDWEEYNYQQEPAAGGGRQAENPFAALLSGIPDFNIERDRSVGGFAEDMPMMMPTPDDTN